MRGRPRAARAASSGIGRAQLRECALDRRVELGDERVLDSLALVHPPFLAQRGQLVARQLLSARVREQPIEAADRVAHVVARRCGAAGRHPQLGRGERRHRRPYLEATLQQTVGNGLKQRRDVGERAAQPHFRLGHLSRVRRTPSIRSALLYYRGRSNGVPIDLTRKPETMVWEERWHPLRREWVIVSSHRNDRPWLGETVDEGRDTDAPYDPDCYLCPRNTRVSGKANPDYRSVYVFDNDHPCVGPESPETPAPAPDFFQSRRADGMARVVCYTPRHDLTLAELPQNEIVRLLETFREQYLELGDRPEVRHVLAFENKGDVVGVSNPHPHCADLRHELRLPHDRDRGPGVDGAPRRARSPALSRRDRRGGSGRKATAGAAGERAVVRAVLRALSVRDVHRAARDARQRRRACRG